MNTKTKLICVTPIKNEEWILEKFLSAASLWADIIILADQGSTDSSADICKKFKKVRRIINPSKEYNELERQKLLLSEARKIKGKKVIVALDADEFISGNFISSKNLEKLRSFPKGTVIRFKWANINPNFASYWESAEYTPFAFADDGITKHTGTKIHSIRVPNSSSSPVFDFDSIKIMHYQYVVWSRMESKHRWYQAWERINSPHKNSVSIYRQYHHMYGVNESKKLALPEEWFESYEKKGIMVRDIVDLDYHYWDYELIKLFEKYGLVYFKKENIWSFDWEKMSAFKSLIKDKPIKQSKLDKFVLGYLGMTQNFYESSFFGHWIISLLDFFPKFFWGAN